MTKNQTSEPWMRLPEDVDPSYWEPRERRVLMLASYCGNDNPECTDDLPCPKCLEHCNVFTIMFDPKTVGMGSLSHLRSVKYLRPYSEEPTDTEE